MTMIIIIMIIIIIIIIKLIIIIIIIVVIINNNNNNYNNNNNNNNYNNNNCSNFCGGYIVLTLKLVKNAKENYIQNAIKGASRILSDSGCFDFHIIHLGANSKNERTLVCRFNGIK